MRKVITAAVATALAAVALSAQAQPRGGPPGGGPPPNGGSGGPPPAARVALNQIVLTGVVLAVDPAADRVTIAYEACEPLGWPAGAMPFAMARSGLLDGVQVKQKVRFRLESQRIAEFLPDAPPGAPGDGPAQGGPPPRLPPR